MEAAVQLLAPGEADELIRELERLHPLVATHSRAVAVTGARIARALGADETEQAETRLAGSIHDVGKLTIPQAILDKPGPLTSSEWQLVRLHPAAGERLLHPILGGQPHVLAAVRSHHERWDGRGYPDGLAGTQVPLAARIIAVADAFQAMLEPRPYRRERAAAQALDEIEAHAGTQFDPCCASALRLALVA
jgi:HD-GYP domain-containing protein (c-di-GMP phosphodiesterase class II)